MTITPRASAQIKQLVGEMPDTAGLRLLIKGGGCSGFEYDCQLAESPAPDDKVFVSDGASVFVDPKSFIFLDGTVIDYKTALMGSGFQFSNPNSTGTCGCGVSFSV
jgi:iron-sulfur cluster assembly protein